MDSLPYGQLAHGQLVPWTARPIDNLLHRQLAPYTARPMYNSPHGQLAPWMAVWSENCYIYKFIFAHEQLAPWFVSWSDKYFISKFLLAYKGIYLYRNSANCGIMYTFFLAYKLFYF
jgi:hypothetical protein